LKLESGGGHLPINLQTVSVEPVVLRFHEKTALEAQGALMATTTKKDLIDRIADTTQQKRSDVKRTVQAFLDQVIDELGQGNRLEFRDFGVFEIKERAPRMAQNPKTLERVHVPARKTVKFKVGRLMRETLEDHEVDSSQIVVELKSDQPAQVESPISNV
jgi:integration host factor subunit beta